MLQQFFDSVLQLIVKTSTDLPPDVRAAMKTALGSEPAGTRSSQALTIIAQNIDLACNNEGTGVAAGTAIPGSLTALLNPTCSAAEAFQSPGGISVELSGSGAAALLRGHRPHAVPQILVGGHCRRRPVARRCRRATD